MKTFYEKWIYEEPGYTNLGSFTTALLKCYQYADSVNRKKIATAYPEYFAERINVVPEVEDKRDGYDPDHFAFSSAIAAGTLSADSNADNFAGNYLYRGVMSGKFLFEHNEKKEFLHH